MKQLSQRAPFFMGAAAALMLVLSTAAVYPSFAQTGTATPAPGTETPAASDSDESADSGTDSSTDSSSDSTTGRADKGPGRYGVGGNSDELLAEALGITTEELDAAYLAAASAGLDQAVAEDLLTQTQADALRERLESASGSGFRFHLGGRGFGFFGSDTIDGKALLAEALGISTDELAAAYDEAEAAGLAQAVENGQLTQEQADLVTARRALQEYWATQQQSYEEIVQAAVDAGAITQAQADLLLANQPANGRGFGMGGGMGGHFGERSMGGGRGMMPGMGGRGGFDHGMRGMPSAPDSDLEDALPDDNSSQSSSLVLPSAGL